MNERKFLIRNAKKARDLINGKLIIKPKDKSGDLVTNFDEIIEKFFIKKIKKAYPDFDIVSEEENAKQKLTKNCFVIDPIDGTNNFARKVPMWGIQVACIKEGRTVASVIYLPVYDELYSADKSGAYLNDEKIHVNRQNEKIGVYTVGNTIPQSYEMQQKNPNYRHFGSACFSLAMVACGKTSACFFKENIHPWDFIPGEYLVKQAGGFSFMKNHVRICANLQSWSNLLSTTENFEGKPINIAKKEDPKRMTLQRTTQTVSVKNNAENSLQQKSTATAQTPKFTEKSSKSVKKTAIQNKVPTLDAAQKTAIKLPGVLNLTPSSSEQKKVANKLTIKSPQEKQISSLEPFYIEESEAIIETFKVEIPEPVEPKPLSIDEVLVDKKIEINSEKKPVAIKNDFKVIKKPIAPPQGTHFSLSQARKKKIIM